MAPQISYHKPAMIPFVIPILCCLDHQFPMVFLWFLGRKHLHMSRAWAVLPGVGVSRQISERRRSDPCLCLWRSSCYVNMAWKSRMNGTIYGGMNNHGYSQWLFHHNIYIYMAVRYQSPRTKSWRFLAGIIIELNWGFSPLITIRRGEVWPPKRS